MLLRRESSLSWHIVACSAILSAALVRAINLDVTDSDSIKAAAKTIANGMMTYYTGDQPGGTLGMLPYPPYYWWESGAMWGSLIDYWYYTGDTTFNNRTTAGLQFQVGANNDYEPVNETAQLGNDDQAFWGMAVMSAAEYKFPDPPADKPQWLALAQAVFNRQVGRWDTTTCGGGLRWQIFPFNTGYNYKNSVSNGCLFNLAARLAKYTGNATYSEWAEKIYEWELDIGMIDAHSYGIYDGTTPTENCTSINHLQWTYVLGAHLLGAATMWNITGSTLWYDRTWGLLNSSTVFFRPDLAKTTPFIMYEAECETQQLCNVDQRTFKAWLARWMAATTKLAPWTFDVVLSRLVPSALGAASACTGGATGTDCGFRWYTGTYDGDPGPGQQMCALEVIQSLLINQTVAPVTSNTGGTSHGNPNAGAGREVVPEDGILNIQTRDRAGAWVLTVLLGSAMLGGGAWVMF